MMGSNFILNVTPNWAHGRRQGMTDDETEVMAQEVFEAMAEALEKQIPKKLCKTIYSFMPKHKCDCGYYIDDLLRISYRYCPGCGQAIDWEVEE